RAGHRRNLRTSVRWIRPTIPSRTRERVPSMFPRISRRAEPAHRVLIVIQNLPLALDRRVRTECRALLDAGYGVSVICPKEHADEPDQHVLDGVVVHAYPTPPASSGLASYVREFIM